MEATDQLGRHAPYKRCDLRALVRGTWELRGYGGRTCSPKPRKFFFFFPISSLPLFVTTIRAESTVPVAAAVFRS